MEIEIEISGVTGLICHKFTDAAAEKASSGSRGSSSAVERGSPREQAEPKLYIGLNGKPMIPQPNLLRCIVDGGRFLCAAVLCYAMHSTPWIATPAQWCDFSVQSNRSILKKRSF